jgi:uncharacterized membrane protein YdbT with pleckstrin-like domain
LSYVEKNLTPGEKVLYKTQLHWIVLFWPGFFSLVFGVSGLYLLVRAISSSGAKNSSSNIFLVPAVILLIAAAVLAGFAFWKRHATEMAVTDHRVVVKVGLTSRRTVELLLSKIESIGVEESLFGRMLGYGTVLLRGTGGTPESFNTIAHPLEFRREVQQQIERSEAKSR